MIDLMESKFANLNDNFVFFAKIRNNDFRSTGGGGVMRYSPNSGVVSSNNHQIINIYPIIPQIKVITGKNRKKKYPEKFSCTL